MYSEKYRIGLAVPILSIYSLLMLQSLYGGLKEVRQLLVIFTVAVFVLLLNSLYFDIYTKKHVSLSHQDPDLEFKAVPYNNILHNQVKQTVSCFCYLELYKYILFQYFILVIKVYSQYFPPQKVCKECRKLTSHVLIIVHLKCFD